MVEGLIKTGTQICQSHAWSEQFIVLSLLREKIKEQEEKITKENELHCYSVIKGLHLVLSLLEETKP